MTEELTPLLCFLTNDPHQNNLALKYWSLDPSGKWTHGFDTLMADSGLNRFQLTETLKSTSLAFLPSLRCNSCSEPLQIGNRTEFQQLTKVRQRPRKNAVPTLCLACEAASQATLWESNLLAWELRRKRIVDVLERQLSQARKIDYARLDYLHAALLYATLVAADVGPNDHLLQPLKSQPTALAATLKGSEEVYGLLQSAGILLPAPCTDLSAVTLDEDHGTVTLNIRATTWTLAEDVSGKSMEELLTTLYDRLEEPEPAAIKSLWDLAAPGECERYFVSQCERWNFTHPDIYSPKVAATIRQYLNIFSIGQVWNIIFYVLKEMASLAQERRFVRPHIYNMIPGEIRRNAERRLANEKEIRPWERQSHSEPLLTSTLLDTVLKGGDVLFKTLSGSSVLPYAESLQAKKRQAEPSHMNAAH